MQSELETGARLTSIFMVQEMSKKTVKNEKSNKLTCNVLIQIRYLSNMLVVVSSCIMPSSRSGETNEFKIPNLKQSHLSGPMQQSLTSLIQFHYG